MRRKPIFQRLSRCDATAIATVERNLGQQGLPCGALKYNICNKQYYCNAP